MTPTANAALPLAYRSDEAGRFDKAGAVERPGRCAGLRGLVAGPPRRSACALPLFGQVIDHWHRAGNWTQQWITPRNVIDLFARWGADDPTAILCGALGASRSAAPLFGADATD